MGSEIGMTHQWPFDCDFCERCGQSRQRVVDERLECRGGGNVAPVSARIYRRRVEPLIRSVFNKMGEPA
jgi:hypothetical protein